MGRIAAGLYLKFAIPVNVRSALHRKRLVLAWIEGNAMPLLLEPAYEQ